MPVQKMLRRYMNAHQLREVGCAVVVFSPEELEAADPEDLQDFLRDQGDAWLAANATQPVDDKPA